MIKNGALGEIATMKHFLAQGFEVYAAITDSSTYDCIVAKGGVISKVEVKATQYRNKSDTGWVAHIKSVRSNKTQNRVIYFDGQKVDFLAVYIEPLDKVVVLDARKISQKSAITLLDSDIEPGPLALAAA